MTPGLFRDDKLGQFHRGLYNGWGRREAAALAESPPHRPWFRLVVVRHGMGHHNDMGGALSLFNRDATLNDVGVWARTLSWVIIPCVCL